MSRRTPRGGGGQPVHAGGVQHRLHPTDPHHGGGGADGGGCQTPFDILPAVWVTSALSVLTGIGAAKLLARLWRD